MHPRACVIKGFSDILLAISVLPLLNFITISAYAEYLGQARRQGCGANARTLFSGIPCCLNLKRCVTSVTISIQP